jgi:hypothetical protein
VLEAGLAQPGAQIDEPRADDLAFGRNFPLAPKAVGSRADCGDLAIGKIDRQYGVDPIRGINDATTPNHQAFYIHVPPLEVTCSPLRMAIDRIAMRTAMP